MGLISLLVIGLVVGALARAVLPGRQSLPIWLTMLIGAGAELLSGLVFDGFVLQLILGVIIAIAVIAIMQGGWNARRGHPA
jgi:uncharacterized membrane protein YeaQ/YmgE (transglycosylase-associated protein family)